MQIHGASVNAPTAKLQGKFSGAAYAAPMESPHKTAQDRIRHAIEQAKAAGVPPEALAARVGISRPGLLHWMAETTDVGAIGIGKMMAFARATGYSVDWLLTGQGDPAWRKPPDEVLQLETALCMLAREKPAEYSVIVRMIRSVADDLHGNAAEESPKPRTSHYVPR